MVTIRGATLAGLAAAARLSRLGHDVCVVTGGAPPGGRWATHAGPAGLVVDDLSPVITMPAAWRDLFKKSGAHLVTELNGIGLTLVPTPPTVHVLPDGEHFLLPTERGAQQRAIAAAFGLREADAWRQVMDELGSVWNALRQHALEGYAPVATSAQRRALGLDRSVSRLAARLSSPLSALLISEAGSPTAPALGALSLFVERTFGRWYLADATGSARRASTLIDLLVKRLHGLGVSFVEQADEPCDLVCVPSKPRGLWAPPPNPRPRITREIVDTRTAEAVHEIVDHVRGTRTWLTSTGETTLATTVSSSGGMPDPAWGLMLRSARDWLRRPPIVARDGLRVSACSPAGAYPWAELSSAALAVYELHERLTGADARPTNKNFVMPRDSRRIRQRASSSSISVSKTSNG